MIIPIWQRFLASLIYIPPWSDAIQYGHNIFSIYPFSQILITPALPIIFLEQVVPYGSLIIFIILFFGIVRNQNTPYFIKFAAMQSILVNLLLIIYSYIKSFIYTMLGRSFFLENIDLFIFIITLSIVIFTIIQSIRGVEADLPGISTASKMQI